jgi:hypothetical protein
MTFAILAAIRIASPVAGAVQTFFCGWFILRQRYGSPQRSEVRDSWTLRDSDVFCFSAPLQRAKDESTSPRDHSPHPTFHGFGGHITGLRTLQSTPLISLGSCGNVTSGGAVGVRLWSRLFPQTGTSKMLIDAEILDARPTFRDSLSRCQQAG